MFLWLWKIIDTFQLIEKILANGLQKTSLNGMVISRDYINIVCGILTDKSPCIIVPSFFQIRVVFANII